MLCPCRCRDGSLAFAARIGPSCVASEGLYFVPYVILYVMRSNVTERAGPKTEVGRTRTAGVCIHAERVADGRLRWAEDDRRATLTCSS